MAASDPDGGGGGGGTLPGGVTVVAALRWARECLRAATPSPDAEAELLMEQILDMTRAELFAYSDVVLDEAQAAQFGGWVRRRGAGEPLQYITGVQWFRGMRLAVGPGAMVPRQETELLVEEALSHLDGEHPHVADICTGSGAIALSIARDVPGARVWASDISEEAAAWARRNIETTGIRNVMLVVGDLFESLPGPVRGRLDLVVCNPPYLSEAELAGAPDDVRLHEPALATAAGPTGLEIASRVVEEAFGWLAPGGWLVMETSPSQAERLRTLLGAGYTEVSILTDLAGAARIAEARRPA